MAAAAQLLRVGRSHRASQHVQSDSPRPSAKRIPIRPLSSPTILPLALLLFLLASTPLTCHAAVLSWIMPFPGTLRCILSGTLAGSMRLYESSLQGDPSSNGLIRILVYTFQDRINVRINMRVNSQVAVQPTGSFVGLGAAGFSNGTTWVLPGTWKRNLSNQMLLDTWVMDAPSATLPNSQLTVYDVVKEMEMNPLAYYANVTTPSFPFGALRGQIYRGWPPLPLMSVLRRGSC